MRSGPKIDETNINEPLAMHVIDTLVSNEHNQFYLGLNTNFSSIALMNKNCADCKNVHKYDPSAGNTSKYINGISLSQQANIFQNIVGSEKLVDA